MSTAVSLVVAAVGVCTLIWLVLIAVFRAAARSDAAAEWERSHPVVASGAPERGTTIPKSNRFARRRAGSSDGDAETTNVGGPTTSDGGPA